ncbi:MAG: prenyltransferase, partial [Phycisphaerae bacterium]
MTFAFLALIAMAMLGPGRSAGDEATPALAKYDQLLDKAIDNALAYLAKQQQKNGQFGNPGVADSAAITSLSVMAFLAKGHTPGAGPYGEAINKGVDYILASYKPQGVIIGSNATNGPMYGHCISTLMLSEVSGMVDAARQKRIDQVLPASLKVIVAAQQIKKPAPQQGGWRYHPSSGDSDISCTGWALMSLRSARNGGSAVPKEA